MLRKLVASGRLAYLDLAHMFDVAQIGVKKRTGFQSAGMFMECMEQRSGYTFAIQEQFRMINCSRMKQDEPLKRKRFGEFMALHCFASLFF